MKERYQVSTTMPSKTELKLYLRFCFLKQFEKTSFMRDLMLILHFLGLVMGLGTGIAHLFIGISASKMSAEEAKKFLAQSKALSPMGIIGMVLLVVSGVFLIIPYWNSILHMPMLMLKLFLVIILIVLITMIHLTDYNPNPAKPEAQSRKAALLGKMALVVSLTTLIVAVLVFH